MSSAVRIQFDDSTTFNYFNSFTYRYGQKRMFASVSSIRRRQGMCACAHIKKNTQKPKGPKQMLIKNEQPMPVFHCPNSPLSFAIFQWHTHTSCGYYFGDFMTSTHRAHRFLDSDSHTNEYAAHQHSTITCSRSSGVAVAAEETFLIKTYKNQIALVLK